jgi:hypothetical protein
VSFAYLQITVLAVKSDASHVDEAMRKDIVGGWNDEKLQPPQWHAGRVLLELFWLLLVAVSALS